MSSQEFFFNPDFDESLRGPANSGSQPTVGRTVDSEEPNFLQEMAMHFLFAGGADDSFILHAPLPNAFLEYLSQNKITPPRLVIHPEFSFESVFTPFGWNAHAEQRSRVYKASQPHPPLNIIATANSRAFSLALEKSWTDDVDDAKSFDNLDSLENHLGNLPVTPGFVVKGNHGNAGTANRRVAGGAMNSDDRKIIAQLLRQNGQVVLEPWHERLLDMSVNFFVEQNGLMRRFRGHELLNSRDGAFLGVKIHPTRKPPEPWSEALLANAHGVAKALHALGYFGPVSVDAYVWHSPAGPNLRPLVDINARMSMAFPAHGLAERLTGKTLLWFWSKPRKMNLPENYAELQERLGRFAFDPERRSGILATSPLLLQASGEIGKSGKPMRPKRIGFLFSADGEDQLMEMRAAFSTALGKN